MRGKLLLSWANFHFYKEEEYNMKKRILSVLMAFALALTLLPAEAIASGSSQGDEPEAIAYRS